MRPELNGLFREEDYPAADKLRKKFGVKLEVLPIPSGADFRVQMSAEEQARVSREIDANVRESLMRGTEDLWKRLREVVARMVDRLNEPESRFHGSLVTNVLDLVEILPRLNVNGDTDLAALPTGLCWSGVARAVGFTRSKLWLGAQLRPTGPCNENKNRRSARKMIHPKAVPAAAMP